MVFDEVLFEVIFEVGVVELRFMLFIVLEKFGLRYVSWLKLINVYYYGVKLMILVEISWLKKLGFEFC